MRIFIFTIIAAIFSSCDPIDTGSFWLDFKRSSIESKYLNHGPWGGTTLISWEFTEDEIDEYQIREFAEKNEWLFKRVGKEFIFPYDYDTPKEIIKCIEGDFTILTFKTDWILVEPGSGETFNALGYVFINPQRSKMTVYHRWGE